MVKSPMFFSVNKVCSNVLINPYSVFNLYLWSLPVHRGSVLNMNKEQKIADLKITTCKKSLQKKLKFNYQK